MQANLFGVGDVQLVVPASQAAVLQETEIGCWGDFVTEAEESSLLGAIDGAAWLGDLRRRVQHYGYRYDYTKRNITEDDKIGELPDWSLPIADRLVADGIFSSRPDQLIVNEYEPGQGIAPHIDRDCFGPVVAAVSLGSDCMLQIYPPNNQKPFDLVVLRRSMMAYRGVGRTKYMHGIAPRKTDEQNGKKIKRGRRVSLTFRTVKH